MTTQTYSAVIDHTTDAGFRAWGSALSTNLAAAGLVQTADTGQINWTTVTRPGTSTAAGYEIWRFADSSLYLKIEYGTGGSATLPQMWVTVGTGSSGSGTLTGQSSTRSIWSGQTVAQSTVTTYTTYIGRNNDVLSIVWGLNALGGSYPLGLLCVGKTVDGTGASTTTGFAVLHLTSSSGGNSLQSVRIAATAATYNDTTNFLVVPGNPTSSLVGSDIQAYQCWMNVPQVLPFIGACVYVISEITKANTFTTAMVGSTPRTYFAIGALGSSGTQMNGQGTVTYSFAFLYE
jgi:hypothetical protein